jgi:WhiB family redox-sensing transcriptional regulator
MQAKVVCGSCPYLMRCRDYGLAHFEHWGIWGGLTFEQRRRTLRRWDKKKRDAE